METAYGDKYSFVGEWYDSQASVMRRYNVFYFPSDDTVEMFDLKTRKTFVRRVKVNGISLDKFYIGGTLLILGRLVKIIDFACEDTRKKLQKDMETTFVLIKPIPTNIAGKIITYLNEHGLRITKMKKARLTQDDITFFYRELVTDPAYPDGTVSSNGCYAGEMLTMILTHLYYKGIRACEDHFEHLARVATIAADCTVKCKNMGAYNLLKNMSHSSYVGGLRFLIEYLTGQLVTGMELTGKNAVTACIECLGDRDPLKAAPGTVRALYGTDSVRNCVHASATPKNALEDVAYFFSSRLRLTATLANCTLCVVKPHAVVEGRLGAALEVIHDGGFEVSALNMLIVEVVNAAEFLEVYKGIVPEYKGMVEELASGPCVAMELTARDKSVNTAVEFRKLVGPSDPEIARLLRPHTLRAKLGTTKVRNAVHCSDLPEDGLLEVEYFFKILDS